MNIMMMFNNKINTDSKKEKKMIEVQKKKSKN